MGRVGERPPREVLFADARRTRQARIRAGPMESALGRDLARYGGGLRMRTFDRLRHRLRAILRRGRLDSELSEELQYHLHREIDQNIVRGLTPSEARVEALRAIGGMAQIAEECRDARG